MRYLRTCGLSALAVALTALAAAGAAPATTLDDGVGPMGVSEVITLVEAQPIRFHQVFGETECEESHVEGWITNAGGAGTAVSSEIMLLGWGKCNATVHRLKKGSFSVSHSNGSNGNFNSNGTEVTVEYLGFHCIFTTINTKFGTLTGGTPAKVDMEVTVARTGGRSGIFCGSSAVWTGSYEVTSPSTLNVTSN